MSVLGGQESVGGLGADPADIPIRGGGSGGASVVGGCSVTNCQFNLNRQCSAGTVLIEWVDGGMAHCATYSPIEGSDGLTGSEYTSGHIIGEV